MTQGPLSQRTALVTGAAHPIGMGAAACRKLAAAGAHVIASDIDVPKCVEGLQNLRDSIRDAGGTCDIEILDVTDTISVTNAFSRIQSEFGGLDILFNNAGLGRGIGPFLEIDDDEWDAVMAVNVRGVVNCCRAAIPQMQSKGGGVIINNASIAGLGVVAEMSGYSTSKYAVVGLTKSIAAEFGLAGIRCNAICPGTIKTAMFDLEVAHQMEASGRPREEVVAELDALAALGRAGEPDEVADAVVYLAGPGASFITGVALPVSGGMGPGL